jgi:predicted DNA-binding transcriptional regulator AlpA
MTDVTIDNPHDQTARQVRGTVGIVNEDEMAAILQISHETLATWRTRRRGPPSIKLGKKVFYAVADFGAWVQEELQRQRASCCPQHSSPASRRFKEVHVDDTQAGLHVHY